MKLLKRVSIGVVLCVFMLTSVAAATDVNLSVAASMKEVVNFLSDQFAQKNPSVKFVKNYGASGALAKQIENGAPADIFISANLKWVDYLKDKKLMDNQNITMFAYNELVFVGKPNAARGMQDLSRLGKIAIGSPQSVPAGEYTTEALQKAGMDKALENKLVMAKDVRACLMYAEQGEVDGAFVYKTDALLAGKNVVVLFTVPQTLYSRVTYPIGLMAAGAKNKDAVAFFRFLISDEGKKVLEEKGFLVR